MNLANSRVNNEILTEKYVSMYSMCIKSKPVQKTKIKEINETAFYLSPAYTNPQLLEEKEKNTMQ